MSLRPLADRVIVLPVAAEEKVGSVYIPDAAQERPSKATVVAVGPGSRDQNGVTHPVGVQAGETVLFAKFGGMPITLDGEEHLVLREGDLLGVYEDE